MYVVVHYRSPVRVMFVVLFAHTGIPRGLLSQAVLPYRFSDLSGSAPIWPYFRRRAYDT